MGINGILFNLHNLAAAAPGNGGAAKAPAPVACQQPQFSFTEQKAELFITETKGPNQNKSKDSIASLTSEIKSLEGKAGRLRTLGNKPGSDDAFYAQTSAGATRKISQSGEKYAVRWLFKRRIGIKADDDLEKAVTILQKTPPNDNWTRMRKAYWLPQFAMILSSWIENPVFRTQLEKLVPELKTEDKWKNANWQNLTYQQLIVIEELVLRKIETKYLKNNDRFSYLLAENYFRRCLVAKSQGNIKLYKTLRGKAKTYIQRLATTDELTDKTLKARYNYFPKIIISIPDTKKKKRTDLLQKEIARANMLMAKLLVFEGNDLENQSTKVLSKLSEARKYLPNTNYLEGTDRIEARELLTGILIREGFELKNSNDPNYICRFQEAVRHLDYIDAWKKAFVSKTPASRDLKRITSYATFSRAKLLMVLAGEIKYLTGTQLLDLFRQYLTDAQKQKLAAGADKEYVLKVQQDVLTKIRETEIKACEASEFLRGLDAMDLKLLKAENYGREAFIVKDLGKKKDYQDLFGKAKKILFEEILKYSELTDPMTTAMSHYWVAKILSIEAGDKDFKTEQIRLANQAEPHIGQAIAFLKNQKKSPDPLLSLAYQAYGEIYFIREDLINAKKMLNEALVKHPQNFEAKASLADILSQQALYKDALDLYQDIITNYKYYLIVDRAKLGQAEALMRQGENYSTDNKAWLENLAFTMFKTEPVGSFLIPRAINGLTEAYSVKEEHHGRIIFIADKLLGTTYNTANNIEKLKPAINDLVARKIDFNLRFRTQLYLKLAEALVWRKRFDEAEELLKKLDPNNGAPADQKIHDIVGMIKNDERFNLSYRLLRAELQMRKDKEVTRMMDPVLERDIKKARDPDLFTRLVFGKIEAYEISAKEESYKFIIPFVRQHLAAANLSKTEQLFKVKGRMRSFLKFKFRLWLTLTNVLSRDEKYYEEAEKEFKALRQAIQDNQKEKIKLSKELADLFDAQILVGLGSLYTYDWDKKSFKTAKDLFEEAIDLYKNETHLPKKAAIAMTEAHFMLGEVHRFGEDDDQDFKDYPRSKDYYEKAQKIITDNLSAGSKDYKRMYARIEYGLGELCVLEGRLYQAFLHFQNANDYREYVPSVTQSQMGLSYNKLARRYMPSLSPQFKHFMGDEGRSELQFKTDLTIPLFFIPGMNWLQLDSQARIDVSPDDAQLYSFYLGPKIVTDIFSIGYKGRLGTWGGDDSDFNKFRFISFPDHMADIYFGHGKYGSIQGSVGIDTADMRRSTIYAAGRLNLGWTESDFWKGLSFVADYNHFAFRIPDPGSTTRLVERHQVGVGAAYDFSGLIGEHLTPRWELAANFKQLFHDPILPPEGVIDTQDRYWQAGVEFGATTGVYVSDWLKLDASYTGQLTSGYNMHTFGFGFSIVPPPDPEDPD